MTFALIDLELSFFFVRIDKDGGESRLVPKTENPLIGATVGSPDQSDAATVTADGTRVQISSTSVKTEQINNLSELGEQTGSASGSSEKSAGKDSGAADEMERIEKLPDEDKVRQV